MRAVFHRRNKMFKFYLNRKVRHPSISVKSKDKKKWRNLPITHSKPSKDTFIVIEDPHPKAKNGSIAYVRKYVREDKYKFKGYLFRKYKTSSKSERAIKDYLKAKYKKR